MIDFLELSQGIVGELADLTEAIGTRLEFPCKEIEKYSLVTVSIIFCQYKKQLIV